MRTRYEALRKSAFWRYLRLFFGGLGLISLFSGLTVPEQAEWVSKNLLGHLSPDGVRWLLVAVGLVLLAVAAVVRPPGPPFNPEKWRVTYDGKLVPHLGAENEAPLAHPGDEDLLKRALSNQRPNSSAGLQRLESHAGTPFIAGSDFGFMLTLQVNVAGSDEVIDLTNAQVSFSLSQGGLVSVRGKNAQLLNPTSGVALFSVNADESSLFETGDVVCDLLARFPNGATTRWAYVFPVRKPPA
jgi:hypothetical protein